MNKQDYLGKRKNNGSAKIKGGKSNINSTLPNYNKKNNSFLEKLRSSNKNK